MRKIATLAVLITLTHWLAGCTCTIESDWPGGWGRLDKTQHTSQYNPKESRP